MATRTIGRGSDTPERVLAIYAHPDDPEVACAGTLAAWATAGADITAVSVARGDKGGQAPDPDLADRRAAESSAAAEVVGIERWLTLGIDDGEVDNSTELRRRLVSLIREHRPDTVLTSDPTAVFVGDHYINHRDHREVGWAVMDSVSPAAASGSYYPDAGPTHSVSELLFSGTLEPNCWVDISATIDIKIDALACHRSQLAHASELGADELSGDASLVGRVVRHRAEEDGRSAGLDLAESFRRIAVS
jgi:LmbE family N-acetylglucosaminyl deacetylase